MASPFDIADPYEGPGTGAVAMSKVMLLNFLKFPAISTFDPTPSNVYNDYYGYLSACAFGGALMMIVAIIYAVLHLTVYLCCTCRCTACCTSCKCCKQLEFDKSKPNWVYFGISMGVLALSLGAFVPVILFNDQGYNESSRLLDLAETVFEFKTSALSQVRELQTSFDPALATAQIFVNQSLDVNYNGTIRDDLANLISATRDVQSQIEQFGDQIDVDVDTRSYLDQGRTYIRWQYYDAYMLFGVVILLLGLQYAASYSCAKPSSVCQGIVEAFAIIFMTIVIIAMASLFITLTGLSHICTQEPAAFAKEVYSSTATDYYLNCDGTTTSPLGPTFDDGELIVHDQQTIIEEALIIHNDTDLLQLHADLDLIRIEINATRDFLRCHTVNTVIVNLLESGCNGWFDAMYKFMIATLVAIFVAIEINFCLMPRKPLIPHGYMPASTSELMRFSPPVDYS